MDHVNFSKIKQSFVGKLLNFEVKTIDLYF